MKQKMRSYFLPYCDVCLSVTASRMRNNVRLVKAARLIEINSKSRLNRSGLVRLLNHKGCDLFQAQLVHEARLSDQ